MIAATTSIRAAFEQPRDAPRLELFARYGGAAVRLRRKERAARRAADEGHRLRAQIREQVQQGTIPENPVDGECSVLAQPDAASGTDLRNARHDVALTYGQQAPVMREPVRVARLPTLGPIELCGRGCRFGRGIRQ